MSEHDRTIRSKVDDRENPSIERHTSKKALSEMNNSLIPTKERSLMGKKTNPFNDDDTKRGYISVDSYVADTAFVSGTARVLGGAQILDEAEVSGNSIVLGAVMKDKSLARDNAFVGPGTVMEDISRVFDNGHVIGAKLSGGAAVEKFGSVDGQGKELTLEDEVTVGGHARILGHNILKGSTTVRGDYIMQDLGDNIQPDLYLKNRKT